MEAHGQAVIDAFKKFDKDGNGVIDRKELGAVLKSLDGETWDDESVNRVLALADTSGDGVLYFEEFVKWMLASDNQVMVGGDFSFIVSGCSRSELNGEYLQQDQFYGHRPVFYCGDNKQMLFYKEETGAGAWQIHSKPGKRSSARLETKRAPHMAEAQWTVWQKDAEGVGTFVQESDMTCTQGPPPSPEEKRAQAPESLYFDSPTLQCVMKKQEKLMGGRNMYASDEGTGCICIYTDGQEAFYGWLFFQSKEVQLVGQKAITTSHPTRSYSPHLCLWKDGVSVLTAEPKKTRLAPREIGAEPWVDPDFPPTKENVGLEIWETKSSPTWTRLSEIRDNPVLFNEEDPFDIDQGGLGNCWLIGTMAALAEYQPYLRDHIFVSKDVPPDGRYQIRLFDIKERDWVIHEVDDLVPCHKESSPHHHDIPYFCRGRALWSMILEKAFAKLEGSYQGLSGKANGDLGANQVVFMLTGGTVNHHFRRSIAEQNLWVTQISREVTAGPESTSEKKGTLLAGAQIYEMESQGKRMKYKLAPGTQPSGLQSGTEEGWISTHQKGYNRCLTLSISAGWSYRHWQMGPHKDWSEAFSKYRTQLEEIKGIQEEVMWQKLVEIDKGSCISTCNFDRRNGLVDNHRYTLVHCVEVNGFKLVGLRNPWGHTEWKGAWSDQSEEWEAHPEVKEALKFTSEDDGLFWMDFADFYTKAGEVCCNVAPNPLPRHASLVVHR